MPTMSEEFHILLNKNIEIKWKRHILNIFKQY